MIEFGSDSIQLPVLESGDLDQAPAVGGPDHGAVHELEDRLFAKGVGNDLEAPALLDEQALQKVRCADGAAVIDRHPQVRDAGLEVVLEAGDGRG